MAKIKYKIINFKCCACGKNTPCFFNVTSEVGYGLEVQPTECSFTCTVVNWKEVRCQRKK
jgi:hypothetical protein